MQFGLLFANIGPHASGEGARRLAVAAEAAGFESIWAVEHVVVPAGYRSQYPYDQSGKMPGGAEDFDLPDPLIWLAWAGAATQRINLGTGVLILPQRNPVVLAKEVATLDSLSGGRVRLGVGVGWLSEEFEALGVPFARRGARTDDYLAAMQALWSQDVASHQGPFVSFERVYSRPQPPRRSVHVVVGGHSPQAARRAGRFGDGFFPGKGGPTALGELFEIVRRSAEEAGRDPSAIEFTAGGKPEAGYVERLSSLGVTRMILPAMGLEHVERWGREIVEPFRAI
jgi:probable F420-dependent oxidoreductase